MEMEKVKQALENEKYVTNPYRDGGMLCTTEAAKDCGNGISVFQGPCCFVYIREEKIVLEWYRGQICVEEDFDSATELVERVKVLYPIGTTTEY